VATAELEVVVAGAGQLDPVAVPGRQFRGVPRIDGHLRAQGRAGEPDRGRVVPAGMHGRARPFTLMASRFAQSGQLADRQARIPDLPGAVTIAFRRDGGRSLLTGKP
jgi:hypothetical protein